MYINEGRDKWPVHFRYGTSVGSATAGHVKVPLVTMMRYVLMVFSLIKSIQDVCQKGKVLESVILIMSYSLAFSGLTKIDFSILRIQDPMGTQKDLIQTQS